VERNEELSEFLRARRAQVRPEEIGVSTDGRRRVPGLRREEVAQRAGVSVDYYTRLEQGRVRPSDSVLDALARSMRFTPAQRNQLFILIRGKHESEEALEPVSAADISGLLDAVHVPAIVVGRGTKVIAANRLHQRLTTNFDERPHETRYYAHWLFLDAAAQRLLIHWEHSARETVGVLRASAATFPNDRRLAELIAFLRSRSDPFAMLWDEYDVAAPASTPKQFHHPVVGNITLLHRAARLDEETWMHFYWAEPGSPSEQTLHRLLTLNRDDAVDG
jgi:transcriptional regulator with XRE-family HTH domain